MNAIQYPWPITAAVAPLIEREEARKQARKREQRRKAKERRQQQLLKYGRAH